MILANSIHIEKDIQTIETVFKRFDLNRSKDDLLKALCRFEQQTAGFLQCGYLSAIINWHKSLFLQKTGFYARSEELLDEALTILEDADAVLLQRWQLKIYLSLGYVHRAQWNFSDAQSYLKNALELALSDGSRSKFLGEIYSLLSRVNFDLGHFSESRKYVTLEKETSLRRYKQAPESKAVAVIYAYSLMSYSRINRRVGFTDHHICKLLNESIRVFDRFQYVRGLLKARLELAESEFQMNTVTDILDTVRELEQDFKIRKMLPEKLQAGLLVAKIHKKIFEYEQAERELNKLIETAQRYNLHCSRCMADIYYEMGTVYFKMNLESQAFECFRQSAKIGMIMGIKGIIIRSFEGGRRINRYRAQELLNSDLIYQDAMFFKNRFERDINPFMTTSTKAKLYASTMFVDIVGFSNLMKNSDEELTLKMVDELIDRLSLIIYQNDGYIDKFLGDGFMAIFEHGHELNADVAFKAIKSGMDIHRALKHKNRNLKTAYHVTRDIKVRIGLSTGEIYAIVLGNYIKREFTYLGNAVNFASKLESGAKNKLMLVDQITYDLARDRIHAEEETIIIPGIGKSTAYQVFSLARMHSRGIKRNSVMKEPLECLN